MKICRVLTIAALVFLLSNFLSIAQEQSTQVLSPGRYNMQSDNGTTTIPFELERNKVFIRAQVNGKSFRLVLDTGCPIHGAMLFSSTRVDELDLQHVGQIMVGGAGGEPMPADMATGITLQFPNLELMEQTVVVIPHNPFKNRIEFDGIIGYALFSRFVVEIDFADSIIILTKPDKLKYSGTGQELPITLKTGYPFLTCTAEMLSGAKVLLQLVVDLGATHALSLNVETHKDVVIPENAIEFRLGTGIGGDVNGYIGRISRLNLGKFTLKNVLTSFSEKPLAECPQGAVGKEGNLGTDALRRFNVTFDYENERIILEPNSHFNEPFEFNMAGIQFTRTEKGNFKIDRVISNSPANESGVKVDDIVIEINDRPAAEFTEDDLEQLLKKEGAEVNLGLSRSGKQIKISLRLRRLI